MGRSSGGRDVKIALYRVADGCLKLRPGKTRRDRFSKHAYKCPPLTVANRIGWDLYASEPMTVEWNGGARKGDVIVHAGPGYAHFGQGTFTLASGFVWRLAAGWDLLLMPMPNGDRAADFAAMTALVETDWLPYPWFLTMSLTRPGTIEIPAGVSLARVLPIKRDRVEDWEIVLEEEPPDDREKRLAWGAARKDRGNHFYYTRGLKRGHGRCRDVDDS